MRGNLVGNRITSAQTRRAHQLTGQIAECYDFSGLEKTLFHTVAEEIGADTSVLLKFRQRAGSYEFNRDTSRGVGSDVHDKYIEKFHTDDPVLVGRKPKYLPAKHCDATTDVFRLSDVCDQNAFVRTKYYNEFLKPAGIRHVLALAVRPQSEHNDLMVVIGFHRPLGMRNFSRHAIDSVVSIAPIIGSTIAKLTFKEHMKKYKALSDGLGSILQETGFIILDDALQIQEISSCVTEGKYGNLPFLMQEISLACRTLKMENRKQIIFTCLRQDAERSLVNENINIDIHCIPMANGRYNYAIRIGFVRTNIAISQCASKFGWTSRESEIVLALAQGLTNTQAAQYLKISVRTIENHLRSVYSKADVTSRTQLLRQLLISTPAQRLI